MRRKYCNRIRAFVVLFVAAVIPISTVNNSFLLSIAAVVTGMIFLSLVRSKAKIRIDEREKTIREKAANLTYAIFAPTIGIGALLLMIPSRSGISVFAKGEFAYLESLGIIFAYLTLFLIAIYAISYYFLNREFGGSSDEE
jgi:uncharacterized membrane protein